MLYPQTNAIRLKTNLDGLWQWSSQSGNLQKNSKWIQVPGQFNRHPELIGQKKYIWVKTDFFVNTMQLTQRLTMCFSSISHSAVIYINGQAAATHEGAGIPLEITINDLVQPGVNELMVYVSCLIDQHSLSGVNEPKASDLWGIDGHVWLQTTPWSYFDQLMVKTTIKNDQVTAQLSCTFIGDVEQINWYLYHEGKLLDESIGKNAELVFNANVHTKPLEMTCFQIEAIASEKNLPIDHYICRGGYHPDLLSKCFYPNRIFFTKDESTLCERLLYSPMHIGKNDAILVHPSGHLTDILLLADCLQVPLILELPPFPESSNLSDHPLRLKLLSRLIEWHHQHPSLMGWGLGNGSKARSKEEKNTLHDIIETKDPMWRLIFERDHNKLIFADGEKQLIEI